MPYHIKKDKNIQGRATTLYYQGDLSWTATPEKRKIYQNESDAVSELYHFRGDVILE